MTRKTFEGKPPMTIWSNDQSIFFDDGYLPMSPDATSLPNILHNPERLNLSGSGEAPTSNVRPKTLGEALAFAEEHHKLSARMRAEVLSAVRVLEKVTGQDADQLPAAPEHLTPLIEGAHPARHRVKPKRWSNAKSAIRSLLRGSGLHTPLDRGKPPSEPAWVALLDALPTRWARTRVHGYACWCSNAGVHPSSVTDQTLADYARFRRTQTIRTHLNELQSSIRTVWNRSVRARLPGWPARQLTIPRAPNVEALPLSSFPASLQTDLAKYLSERTEPDAFDIEYRQWRPATAKSVRRFLIYGASLVAQRDGGPENVRSLADIVTVDAAEFALRHVFERSGNVWRGHAGTFATYLLAVARDFVRVDAATLFRLEELHSVITKRLREQRRSGLSERVSQRIMPFDDQRLLRRFFQLPGDLYRAAKTELEDKEAPRPVRAAQLHEQGLMLDLLQHDPMRRFNLAAINYLEDFVRDEKGRITRLWMSGEKVKNGITIDTPIPPDLEKRIRTHLTVYRPHLRGSRSPWLFASPTGNARSPDNVTKTLHRIVTRRLGVTFTPHMMRHIVATELYRRSPHNGVVVQRKLRHTSIKSTERMYGVMSNAGANAEWQADLDRFRRVRTSTKRRNRRDD